MPRLDGQQFYKFYHGTGAEGADAIAKQGFKGGSFLSSDRDVAEDYGDHIFVVKVPSTHKFARNENEYQINPDQFHGFHGDPDKSETVIHATKGVVVDGPHQRSEDWG
jgi:hypothetical protein